MRFVWVNERVDPMKAFCAFDYIAICQGYIREVATGLVYHDRC
jgi:hypothetical protein